MKSNDPFRIFPRATLTERQDLCASIEAVGLKNSIVLDADHHVIDGHERRDICEELGIDWYKGADVRDGLSEIEKKALAIELNMWRRPLHLTRPQRNTLIEIYLIAHPELSDEKISELFGVDRSTVNRRRKKLVQTHKLPKVETTIGTDGVKRKVGKRIGSRLIVKSRKEYDSVIPDIKESGDAVSGLIRRPKRFSAVARRKRALASVKQVRKLPTSHSITCCDFRNLEIEPESVDLILTDVVWTMASRQDWFDLGKLAKTWLKPDGLFVSYIGTSTLPYFCNELMNHLKYVWTISLFFEETQLSFTQKVIEQWRPIVVFGKRSGITLPIRDTLNNTKEKDYHDWQQSLPAALELVEKLSNPGDVICDPQMGSGTNAVAAAIIRNRKFIGCDIDAKAIKIARHRVVTEGKGVVA